MSAVPYEALGPDRFQLFCQSLLSYEHPELQAYPLNEADGGRDATARDSERREAGLIYQVKFAAHPETVKDPVSWLAATVEGEREKIAALAQRGATTYRIVTNVRGSGRLDRGQIDRVRALLNGLPISDAACLWRNDVDRRLAKHPLLKWSFRELLTGQDVLDGFAFGELSEQYGRRVRALRSFLAMQAEEDRVVRFRQVGLRNELLDLWVDVPMTGFQSREINALAKDIREHIVEMASRHIRLSAARTDEVPLPAAAMLLHSDASSLDRILVHGAPGQGKSTLVQYVCQVHRARLLLDEASISRIGTLADSPLRVPYRVDVKQLAAYLGGQDPFDRSRSLQANAPLSLDGFLAHLVSRTAGGDTFDVSDLKVCLALGRALIVLDGLDEVADATERKQVIEAIERGATTLRAAAPHGPPQIVVTSRPASFSNVAGLDGGRWRILALTDLPTRTVMSYASGWSRVQGLTEDEGEELRELLETRLAEPHFAELVRNPMQLAIVLSLLLLRGRSLPDKRTQLYWEYMSRFLDREAQKSVIIAEQRDLVFNLHGYLAFRMHSAAELDGAGGAILAGELQAEIERYVAAADADRALVEKLLEGIVERVMALVSRDGEHFEFEVQPLREFFAGYYLHDTAAVAQYEPVPGTLPDRFEVLARNPYWLNVARFYAGRYASVALDSLAQGLADLQSDPVWASTEQPRLLATMLLRDNVFALNAHARDHAVDAVVDWMPDRHTLSQSLTTASRTTGPILVDDASVRRFTDRVLVKLAGDGMAMDRRVALTFALRAHRDAESVRRCWRLRMRKAEGDSRRRLLLAGCHAGLLRDDREEVADVVAGGEVDNELAIALLRAAPRTVEASRRLRAQAVEAVMRSGHPLLLYAENDGPLLRWACAMELAARGDENRAYRPSEWWDSPSPAGWETTNPRPTRFDGANGPRRQVEEYGAALTLTRTERRFGTSARLLCAAVSIAASRPKPSRAADSPVIQAGLVRARAESRVSRTWLGEIESASEEGQQQLVAFCICTWGKPHVLDACAGWLGDVLDRLATDEWHACLQTLRYGRGPVLRLKPERLLRLPPRVTAAVMGRLDTTDTEGALQALGERFEELEPATLNLVGELALDMCLRYESRGSWSIEMVRRVYAERLAWLPRPMVPLSGQAVSPQLAKEILSSPREHPLVLVECAERRSEAEARRTIVPLATVATERAWFPEL